MHLLDTLGDVEADAARAGLGRAMSVVVRSDGPRPTRTYVEHMSDPAAHATRADAVTILTTLRVERCVHPGAHVISEMLHGDTLAQLSAETVGMRRTTTASASSWRRLRRAFSAKACCNWSISSKSSAVGGPSSAGACCRPSAGP